MTTRKVLIHWTSEELFSSVREVNESELLEWLGNPESDRVTEDQVKDYINACLNSGQEFDLTAMSEGTTWHDRNDPTIDNVELR